MKTKKQFEERDDQYGVMSLLFIFAAAMGLIVWLGSMLF